MRVVLIHGYKASGQSGFFPWLSFELRRKGCEVLAPDLPNPEEPDPDAWTKALLEQVGAVDEETMVIGHSLGGALALRFLEAAEARSTPRGCILVATPWMIRDERFQGFFLSELDFEVLMWKASRFLIIHARDDQVIPFDHAEKYARVLHAKLIEGAAGDRHFQDKEHPVILKAIEDLVAEEIVCEPGESLQNEYADITT